MSWRRVVMIYAIVAILAGYVLVFERSATPGDQEGVKAVPASILGTEPSAVTAVTFGKDGKVVRARREGDRWRAVEPAGVTIQPDLIEATIATLTAGQSAEVLSHEPENALSAYGLDTPSASVQVVVGAQDHTITILVGARNPTGTAVYARRSDQATVFLVGMNLSYYIDLIFEGAKG